MLRRLLLALGLIGALATPSFGLSQTEIAVLFSGPPPCVLQAYGKWQPLPDLVADDATQCYWVKGGGTVAQSTLFSNSRIGTRWGANAAGVLVSAPAGSTLIIPDGTGAYEFESRRNVVLWNRDLTNAAWTLGATMASAKDQTGADGVANSASSITASGITATNTILQSTTFVSSARFQTAYVKRLVGTGTVNMTMDGGSTWTAITVTGAWTRVSIPTQTLANPNVGFQLTVSGDSIAVDFVNNTNGTFATAPIDTTTVPVTVSADIRTGTALFNSIAQRAQTFFFKTNAVAGGTTPFMISAGAADIKFLDTTDVLIEDGINSAQGIFGSGTYAGVSKSLYRASNTSMVSTVNGGSPVTQSTSVWATAVSGQTFVFGNIAASNRALNGQQQQFALWLTQPALTGITVP